jgi:hypothetical protein
LGLWLENNQGYTLFGEREGKEGSRGWPKEEREIKKKLKKDIKFNITYSDLDLNGAKDLDEKKGVA